MTPRITSRSAKSTTESAGLKHGWRSGLEEAVGAQLTSLGIPFDFEGEKITFLPSTKPRTYLPDFRLPNGIIVETKGRFVTADRQKHLLIKQQHPTLDIRFVFSNPRVRIGKKSKTTYAMWCDEKGFKWAEKRIPASWLPKKGTP